MFMTASFRNFYVFAVGFVEVAGRLVREQWNSVMLLFSLHSYFS